VRWNASKAFLRPVAGRRNLTVWTHSPVRAIELERTEGAHAAPWRAVGVRVRHDGAELSVRAAGNVVVAAGAVATPHLLQLSGIGSRETLAAAGITPRHELNGVGENLHDHLQIRAVFAVQGAKTLNETSATVFGKAAIALEYLVSRSGPMSMSPSQLGAFARSSVDKAWPDLEYHVQPLSLDAFGEPLHRDPAITASVCNLEPTSRGTVRARSGDPDAAPSIQPNYLSTDEDRLIAARSLRITRRIVEQPALARYSPREVRPGAQFQSDEDLARLAGDIGTTIFHPVGTCRMGRADDEAAVVDSELRVRGVDKLRIVDASVMPSITSGNTNAPTLMIAERAAALLAASTDPSR
jgi:choline dehydrogenase